MLVKLPPDTLEQIYQAFANKFILGITGGKDMNNTRIVRLLERYYIFR